MEETVDFKRFTKELLEPALAELKKSLEELHDKSIDNFYTVVSRISKDLNMDFRNLFGLTQDRSIDPHIAFTFIEIVIKAINGVLPKNFPFLVTLVITDEKKLFMGTMKRQSVPGIHDMVSPDFLPIVRLKNSKGASEDATYGLHIERINFDPLRYLDPDFI